LWYNGYRMDEKKIEQVHQILRKLQPFIVAYSGGNDSTLLAAISMRRSMDFCAVHCISEFTIPGETEYARYFAQNHRIPYHEITVSVMSNRQIIANTEMRCYYCKHEIFKNILAYAHANSFINVIDASNASDCNDYRPGKKALEELGILSPFVEAGITKDDIYSALADMQIPHAQFSNSCLATRIPYFTNITNNMLDSIAKAETFIAGLGFTAVRVRYHYPIARIEIPEEEIAYFMDTTLRNKVVAFLKELGFLYVTVDCEGFSSGNLNRMLPHE